MLQQAVNVPPMLHSTASTPPLPAAAPPPAVAALFAGPMGAENLPASELHYGSTRSFEYVASTRRTPLGGIVARQKFIVSRPAVVPPLQLPLGGQRGSVAGSSTAGGSRPSSASRSHQYF